MFNTVDGDPQESVIQNILKENFNRYSNQRHGLAAEVMFSFIIYALVAHLNLCRQKAPHSHSLQLHHLALTTAIFLSLFFLQLAQILPTEENFLLCFRQFVSSSAEFMAVRESFFCFLGVFFVDMSFY